MKISRSMSQSRCKGCGITGRGLMDIDVTQTEPGYTTTVLCADCLRLLCEMSQPFISQRRVKR